MARVGDAVALGAPLGQAIGRVGCFLNGCCHGGITDGPCAVVYEHPQSFAEYPGMPVHPAQLYLVAWNLIVFLVVFLIRKKPKPEGASFLIYLILYSAGDFVVRFFRTNDPYALGLQQSQVIGLGSSPCGVPILVREVEAVFLRDELRRPCQSRPDGRDPERAL
jgi:phosphatidylglycerol:prolipoprotein diacylglycerol transferase